MPPPHPIHKGRLPRGAHKWHSSQLHTVSHNNRTRHMEEMVACTGHHNREAATNLVTRRHKEASPLVTHRHQPNKASTIISSHHNRTQGTEGGVSLCLGSHCSSQRSQGTLLLLRTTTHTSLARSTCHLSQTTG